MAKYIYSLIPRIPRIIYEKNLRKSQKNRRAQEITWRYSKPAGRKNTVSKYAIGLNEQDLEDEERP